MILCVGALNRGAGDRQGWRVWLPPLLELAIVPVSSTGKELATRISSMGIGLFTHEGRVGESRPKRKGTLFAGITLLVTNLPTATS